MDETDPLGRALMDLVDAVADHVTRPDRDPELHAAWVTYREAIR